MSVQFTIYPLPPCIATCPWPVKMPTPQSPSLLACPAPSVMGPERSHLITGTARTSSRWQSEDIYRSYTAKEHRVVLLHSLGLWQIFLYCSSMVHHSRIYTVSLLDQKLTWYTPSLYPQNHFLLAVSGMCHSNLFRWQLPHLKQYLIPLSYCYGCSGFQAHFNGSQPSMKFVMDTSKFWFRPHISRAEGENLKTSLQRYLIDDILALPKFWSYFILQDLVIFLNGCGILLQYWYCNKHTFATVCKHLLWCLIHSSWGAGKGQGSRNFCGERQHLLQRQFRSGHEGGPNVSQLRYYCLPR